MANPFAVYEAALTTGASAALITRRENERGRAALAPVRVGPNAYAGVALAGADVFAGLQAGINGTSVINVQTAKYANISESERLVLPELLFSGAPLGDMEYPIAWLASLSFVQMCNMVVTGVIAVPAPIDDGTGAGTFRAATDQFPPLANQFVGESETSVNLAVMVLCAAVGLNMDYRDVHQLRRSDDRRWENAGTVVDDELRSNLHSTTFVTVAALNLPALNNTPFAAVVRSVGVGLGLVPATNAAVHREFVVSRLFPTVADVRTITDFVENWPATTRMHDCCANILALYGLLHLAKDHTYQAGDSSTNRALAAYVNALKMTVEDAVIQLVMNDTQTIVRLACHPFGVSSPYWLSQAMYQKKMLAPALDIRSRVLAPPVQKIAVVMAVVREWRALPVGGAINQVFSAEITRLENALATFESLPPATSHLYRLYGVAEGDKLEITPAMTVALTGLLPMVAGYAMAFHLDENNRKEGVALSLALKNVKTSGPALSGIFEDLWTNYKEAVGDAGLLPFVKTLSEAAAMAAAGR
jgi:hypothetical protein